MTVNPARLMEAVVAAQQAIEGLPEDERLIAGTVEGETELFELMDRYAEAALADKALIQKAEERLDRIKARADRHQDVVRRILDAVGISKLQRPLYSAFFTHRTSVTVTDAAEVPEEYRRPDKVAIGAALRRGDDVPGAVLSNAMPSLTLKAS